MSMFRLTNKTGEDSTQAWANGFTFPNNVSIDLIHPGTYGDPEVTYSVGIGHEDIVACMGGEHYDAIKTLIKSGEWKLGNGSREYYYEEALYILSTGTIQGFQLVGDAKTIVSHDLCQPTTWYQNATQVTDEVLRRVDGAYQTTHQSLICLRRGFMYQEDTLSFQEGFNLKVNGTLVTDATKFAVEPVTGTVTFVEGFIENPDTDVVTCSYEYGSSSVFDVTTDENHLWRILKTEIQLDSNIVVNNSVIMEVVIDHPLAGADYVASQWVYKSARDFISGSNLGFSVPSFGGTKDDAGLIGSIIILPFNYTNPLDLPTGMNARIRLRIENDKAPVGNFATVTFYMDKIKL